MANFRWVPTTGARRLVNVDAVLLATPVDKDGEYLADGPHTQLLMPGVNVLALCPIEEIFAGKTRWLDEQSQTTKPPHEQKLEAPPKGPTAAEAAAAAATAADEARARAVTAEQESEEARALLAKQTADAVAAANAAAPAPAKGRKTPPKKKR